MRVFRFRCSMLNELLVAICWVYVVFSNFLSNVMTVVFGFGAYVLFIFELGAYVLELLYIRNFIYEILILSIKEKTKIGRQTCPKKHG